MRHKILLIVAAVATAAGAADWKYLDNGVVRIGIDRSRGACIGFFGESEAKRNLLNHFDEGRFIQQSVYGAEDGSLWNKRPWRYNPVQGGSWDGRQARTLEFKKSKDSLYAKIEPRNWGGGQPCPEAIMEEWITLDGPLAKIQFKLTYSGEDQGSPRHQEMPAVFVDAVLSNHVYFVAGELVQRNPSFPNEYGQTEREWTAWLDDQDRGIGIYTPGTAEFTCYRHKGSGTTGSTGSACSYVAPIRTFALTKGLEVKYDVYLTIGTLEEISQRFTGIPGAEKPPLRRGDIPVPGN
jgi:hypothetical protein